MNNTIFKKLFSVVLAAAMVFALCGVALADGESADSTGTPAADTAGSTDSKLVSDSNSGTPAAADDTTAGSGTDTADDAKNAGTDTVKDAGTVDTTAGSTDAGTDTADVKTAETADEPLTANLVSTETQTAAMTSGKIVFYIRKDGGSVDTTGNTTSHGSGEYTGLLWNETVTYGNTDSVYGNGEITVAFGTNFTVASLPDDAAVFAAFKTGDFTNLQDSKGETVSAADLDTDNYTVEWYVLKHQSDAWHVDGVLVKKDGFAHKYTLSYATDVTNSAVKLPASVKGAAGTDVTLDTSLDGFKFVSGNKLYTFNGWTDGDGKTVSGSYTMPEKDTTLTASWTETPVSGGKLSYYIRLDGSVADTADDTANRGSNLYSKCVSSENVEYTCDTKAVFNGESAVESTLSSAFLDRASLKAAALPSDADVFTALQQQDVTVTLGTEQIPASSLNTNEYSVNWYVLKQGSDWHVDGAIEKRTYTVTFNDDANKQISTGSYAYGAALTAPADPTRAADGSYTYKFAGWSTDGKTVSALPETVTADTTYTAVYTATAIPAAPVYVPTTSTATPTTVTDDDMPKASTPDTDTTADKSTDTAANSAADSDKAAADSVTSQSTDAAATTSAPAENTRIEDGETPAADNPAAENGEKGISGKKPNGSKSGKTSAQTGTTIADDSTPTAATPKTGDNSAVVLYLLLAVASGIGLTAAAKSKKKENSESK